MIKAEKKKDFFNIQIEDDGIGIEKKRLEQVRTSIKDKVPTGKDIYGLYNVNERIRLNFGEQYGITIESIYGKKTVVSIVLPYAEVSD